MKNNFTEKIITLCLVALALLLLNPFHFWMPDMMVLCLVASLLGVFALFAIFILREQSLDERAIAHRALAGRNAFLIGSGILTLGIVAQGYAHKVDPWLVLALTTMLIAKIATRIWSDTHR